MKKAAEELGWEETSTDADSVIKRPDIDIIDIGTPNDSHFDLAMKAIKAGKIVLCEKPLAMTTKEARTMAAAAKKAGVPNLIWHNYRRAPAATTAAQLIADGKIGEIRHVRAVYLQDWLIDDACPYTWRMNVKTCGSGAHGALNAHLIDMTRFMTGLEFSEVCGMSETFIKKRLKAPARLMPAWMLKLVGIASTKALTSTTVPRYAPMATGDEDRRANDRPHRHRYPSSRSNSARPPDSR